MQIRPLVTVFIPCYNHEKYIREAIQSLKDQTFTNFEAIIIDDASTDNSYSLAINAIGNDKRFAIRRHEKNMGNVATYNEALSMAKGDHIAMLASDDFYHPGFFDACLKAFKKYAGIGAVYTNHNRVGPDSKIIKRCARRSIFGKHEQRKNEFTTLLLSHNDMHIPHSGTMVARKVYEKIKYDPNVPTSCDWLLWLEASLCWDFVFIPECLYNYRIHGQNMHIRMMRTAGEEKECRYILKKLFASKDLPKNISKKAVYSSSMIFFMLKYLKRLMLLDIIRLIPEAVIGRPLK